MRTRRRKGVLLLCLAIVTGGLAASQVRERERGVEARVGPLVPVLVAARDLPPGERLPRDAVTSKQVPARFVPPDALGGGARIAGARISVPVASGSYLTYGQFERRGADERGPGALLGRGQRAVEVGVSGGGSMAQLAAGARVDVIVSTEPGSSATGRTFVALADVELLALRSDPAAGGYSGGGDEGTGSVPSALATVRVSLRQAVYLTAADNFGREIRLLLRPPGDRSRAGAAVAATEL